MSQILLRLLVVKIFLAVAFPFLRADGLQCDMGQYHRIPGLEASAGVNALTVTWQGDHEAQLMLRFAVAEGVPQIRELSVRKRAGRWKVLGRDLIPEFGVTTGVRRSGHGLPEENRWDVFWDAPLSVPGAATGNPNLPRKPEEVRRFKADYHASTCEVKTDGARLEITFPGVSMGVFTGKLQFTVYRGTNLIRQELIARTEEPSVAYIYSGGLKGFSTDLLNRVAWRDNAGNSQIFPVDGAVNRDPVVLRARNRLAVIEGQGGSLAFFPPPHQFFFARELEVNLGYLWYRKGAERSFSVGIRQGESHEGYNPVWIERVFALYNAPPGTWQHMPVYLYATPEGASVCRDAVMAFTHGDRFKPLPGYKTMATHFHTAFTQELMNSGSFDTVPPWIPAIRALGVDIVFIDDFHGDGHPNDPGSVRLGEMDNYYEACRRHSDRSFLILPGEEANVYLGGHYNLFFPRPVYWTHTRPAGKPLMEEDPKYGKVYHTGSAADLFEMMRRENVLVWQTHPRTKGSTFYPDKIRDTDYFHSDFWLGAAFKVLPVDLSQKRLCETRCFGTLDDMNNWDGAKFLVGEVDTYKKFSDYDLYGDFNVNYVKVDSLPSSADWSPINKALRAGDFFVTTGEVLIRHFSIGDGAVVAELEGTFPLEFVEVVWGDGTSVDRRVISATDQPPFGLHRFRISLSLVGKKWVRFAAWDSAGNGAFTQPIHLKQ
ncbi:MAG TPA: hypothetical protein VGQ81_16175 [Acidobacteriota bacterium]|nr:hypothetical protein [Acidobacteriota bacterium]